MEATIDPATGRPLPADAIQRVLHIAKSVHVYNIPPLTSTKGYTAATWTEDPKRHIFTCRARIIETAIPSPNGAEGADKVKVDIVLEDPSTGQLFAAAPYTSKAVVEPAIDSSRFFALRVQDEAGRKATLGIGFEERSDAFDFSIALQEAQKALNFEGAIPAPAAKSKAQQKPEEKKDYSLKDGETITVNLSGTKFGRRARPEQQSSSGESAGLSSFTLPPPPGSASSSGRSNAFLPPPPSSRDVKSQQRQSAKDLGFDDGQFGEFA
ncbi:hypothetical protein QBC46DRAFT_373369 [Diplogelasinospora grovesii]|uniref:NECAP PHear domain-containing protein n=1 Tax=Diplogelasinospora grovesii TaxID=303347 RepID=A0AAN6NG26_9PEZI|nr:hypothetical protein QBC46DRAFT_373369 [Diplogelasinospora grovesii]